MTIKKDNYLKIDFDIKCRDKVISKLVYGLIFLQDLKMVYHKEILSIVLLKKNSYSVKIKLNKKIKPISIIIIQAVLGDDTKRVGICYRDYLLKFENWNRIFNLKQYSSGEILTANVEDITYEILTKIGKKKNVL